MDESPDPVKFASVATKMRIEHKGQSVLRESEIKDWMQSLRRLAGGFVTIENDVVSLEAPPDRILREVRRVAVKLPDIFRQAIMVTISNRCRKEVGGTLTFLKAVSARSIHPFPARMAPEIVLSEMALLEPNSVVLDPMSGSGTVLRVAAEKGHRAIGFDLDPLAVLMTRVWISPVHIDDMLCQAEDIVSKAKTMDVDTIYLPWMDADRETSAFVGFWFGNQQRTDLRRLSTLICSLEGQIGDALKVALSRIIVTKDSGASLARDVSHSRPHRVKTVSDYPVIDEFRRSAHRLGKLLRDFPPPGGRQSHT